MYIPSKTKDVVFTIILGILLLALALTWNSGRYTNIELKITKIKLSNCEDDLKLEKVRVERLKDALNTEQMHARDNGYKAESVSQKILPLLAQHNAIMDMLLRRTKNGELPESMIREYHEILKK